jgi:hypothetical protein
MVIKYTQWPLEFSIPMPYKIYPRWDVWFENKPSGNPASDDETRDRCYDFLNIFAEKFSKKFAFFCKNYC